MTTPYCDSCGTQLDVSEHWRLHDGRLQCSACHRTAIYDVDLARKLYSETVAGVAADLGLTLNVGVDFRMVDAPTLHGIQQHIGMPTPPAPPPGVVVRTLGLYVCQGSSRVIYMLYGVPRLIFRSTIAHEYAHAWQREKCPLLRDITLIEGFAQWVALQHLRWLGATRAVGNMLVDEHPYHDAMHHVLNLEQQLGREGLLNYMRRAE